MADYRNSGGKRELFRCMKLDSSAARCRRVATLTSHKVQSAVCIMRRPVPAVPRCQGMHGAFQGLTTLNTVGRWGQDFLPHVP